MRTEIKKQQIKRTIMHFSCRREKRKKKQKKSIISGNPTIISIHTPHHVEDDTVAHSGRLWIA
jgi:hypothetical protein